MKSREIRELSDEQIFNEMEDLKEALFNLRVQEVTGQLENTNTIREQRRTYARLKTILHERQLAAALTSKEDV
jgi:large subunit ribosomal protein L29